MKSKTIHIFSASLILIAIVLSILILFVPLENVWWWLVAIVLTLVASIYGIPPVINYITKVLCRKRQRRYLHASYKRIKKKLKLPSNVYQTAWFFACAQESSHQDFSKFHKIMVPNLPSNLSVYHVEGALVWLIKPMAGYDTSLFVEWLKEIRPKQPVNGAMLILDAFNLVQRTHKQTDAFIEDFKHNCEDLYHQSDILSPLHVFVSGINKLDGIAEAIYEQNNSQSCLST